LGQKENKIPVVSRGQCCIISDVTPPITDQIGINTHTHTHTHMPEYTLMNDIW